jgi:hypothetical protein
MFTHRCMIAGEKAGVPPASALTPRPLPTPLLRPTSPSLPASLPLLLSLQPATASMLIKGYSKQFGEGNYNQKQPDPCEFKFCHECMGEQEEGSSRDSPHPIPPSIPCLPPSITHSLTHSRSPPNTVIKKSSVSSCTLVLCTHIHLCLAFTYTSVEYPDTYVHTAS